MPEPTKKPGGVKVSASMERTNTLGVSTRDLSSLLDALDATSARKTDRDREFSRWPFRGTGVTLELIHPGGTISTLRVISRNISRGGVSLLHTAFVHPGSSCKVTLPKATGVTATLPGVIRRCEHRGGKLHELGIRFNDPIDLRQFIPLRREQTLLSFEKVDPAKLTGRILLVEDSALDVKILQHFLRETQLRIQVVNSIATAFEALKEPFHLILCDWQLGEERGTRLIAQARDQGIDTPAIMIAADPAGLIEDGLWDLSNTWYLAKPIQQDQLLRAIGEWLIVDRPKEPAAFGRCSEGESEALSQQFAEELKVCMGKLRAAMQANKPGDARQVCWQIKGAAPTFGMHDLAQIAGDVATKLTTSPNDATQAIGVLIAACDRALVAA